ncbi:MAG TPA: hypothetical protein VKD90_17590 [Gemmataceae bacterium]|nr:hypothetical protein [Gemmataceae bacterium]
MIERVRIDAEALLHAWLRLPDRTCTRAKMRKALGWTDPRTKAAIAVLVERGRLQAALVEVNGPFGPRQMPGFRAIPGE